MNNYKYTAYRKDGEKVDGEIQALSKIKAVEDLNRGHLLVAKIREDRMFQRYNYVVERFESLVNVDEQNLVLFLVQLESLLKTGLNIIQASDIVLELFVKDKRFHKVLTHVFGNVRKGESFSDSLAIYPQVFPEIMISMIRVGEQVGELESVVSELVEYYETRNRNVKQIQAMMVYPIFVLSFSLVAILILLYYVIPQFVKLYQTSEENLPALTQFFITLSDGFRANWVIVILVILLIIVSGFALVRMPKVKRTLDSFWLKMPITKEISRNSNLIYISSSLSLMFEKAYDKLKALDLIKNNVSNAVYQEYVYLMFINIYNGNRLLDDFEETENLPTFFKQMVYIGEESSSLGTLLKKSADFYQEKLDRYIASMKSIIEPGLILVILIIILPIILAVVIPMFDVVNTL